MKIIFAVLVFVLTVTSHAQVPVFYTANFYCDEVILSVEVNGFPISHLPESGNSGSAASGIGQYLRKGINEVRILAVPMPKAPTDEDKGRLWNFSFNSGPSLNAQNETPDIRVERIADSAVDEPNGKLNLELTGSSVAQLRHA